MDKLSGRFLIAALVLYSIAAWTYFRGFKYLSTGNDATFSSQGPGRSGAQMEELFAWLMLFFLLILGASFSLYAARNAESKNIKATAFLSACLPIVFLLWLFL